MLDIKKIQNEKPIEKLLNFSIINVDKPAGLTSNECLEKVKKILNIKKTGHFGTLDPMVTGVLPVAINDSCKLSNYFIKKDKEYIGKMRLHSEINKKKLEKEIKKFIGKIIQKPPKRSSVKRVFRERTVNSFEIIEINGKNISFKCDVEAGTYIRTLIHDLGKNIGGAHMTELKRIRAGIFNESESHKLSMIEESYQKYEKGDESLLRNILIPGEIISNILETINVDDSKVKELLNGKPLMKDDFIDSNIKDKIFAVFNNNRFLGIYKKVNEEKIIARPEMVYNQ